jgi:hypothetical protein
MQPASEDIVKNIIAAIDEVILPAIDDKQAASALRAARTLLDHLQKRIPAEAGILLQDNADAAQTFESLTEAFASEPACAALRHAPAQSAAAETIAALRDVNLRLQQAANDALLALPNPAAQSAAEGEIRKALRAYLTRRLARERELFFPTFLAPPF